MPAVHCRRAMHRREANERNGEFDGNLLGNLLAQDEANDGRRRRPPPPPPAAVHALLYVYERDV